MVNPLPGRLTEFRFRVVGVTFADGYPENMHRLRAAMDQSHQGEGPPALLVREPGNVHDANCVRVDVPGVGRVGSVPRELAARLAPELDSGVRVLAEIGGVLVDPAHPDRPGIDVIVRAVDD